MARIEEVSVTLVDDLDGSEAAETIKFSFDGKSYEIDLSKSNAKRLRGALRPFTEHARSARRTRSLGRRTTSNNKGQIRTKKTGTHDPAEVRAWAKTHRIKVAPRGRIAADVVERWQAASKG
jgi:Lsr2